MPAQKTSQQVSPKELELRRISRQRAVLVALVLIGAYGLLNVTGYMNPYLRPSLAPSPDVLDVKLRWGEEFDLWANIKDFTCSVRGEGIIQMILITFVGCFVIQTVVGLFFRLMTNPALYNSFPVRDQWFLGQK